MKTLKVNKLLFGVLFLLYTPIIIAQNTEENEKKINELQRQVEELNTLLDKDKEEPQKEVATDDDLKFYLMQILEETRKTNRQLEKNVSTSNQPRESVVVYIKEIEELRRENEILREEMKQLKRDMQDLSKKVESNQKQITKGGLGGDVNIDQLSLLNENLSKLTQELQVIKEQNEVANEKMDILASGGEINSKVSKLEEETTAIKEKVEAIESKYIILQRTSEAINDRDGINKQDAPPGYYVVVESERYQNRVFYLQKQFKQKNIETQIIQNKRQTWYHLYTDRFDTKAEAVQAVNKARSSGIKDAWWLKN